MFKAIAKLALYCVPTAGAARKQAQLALSQGKFAAAAQHYARAERRSKQSDWHWRCGHWGTLCSMVAERGLLVGSEGLRTAAQEMRMDIALADFLDPSLSPDERYLTLAMKLHYDESIRAYFDREGSAAFNSLARAMEQYPTAMLAGAVLAMNGVQAEAVLHTLRDVASGANDDVRFPIFHQIFAQSLLQTMNRNGVPGAAVALHEAHMASVRTYVSSAVSRY